MVEVLCLIIQGIRHEKAFQDLNGSDKHFDPFIHRSELDGRQFGVGEGVINLEILFI